MSSRHVGDVADALLVFADVVDSSKHSSVLSYQEYAERLLRFQQIFRSVGRRYFPEAEDPALTYSEVDSRGDEGVVFVVEPRPDPAMLVFRAVEFLYHMKGLMRFAVGAPHEAPNAPRRLALGAGVHVGPVACMEAGDGNRSVIAGIEGFEINYAKRVESCSRQGQSSRILLSAEAARCLEFQPVILREVRSEMKGIAADVVLYEVQSGLFDHFELRRGDAGDEELVKSVMAFLEEPERLHEPWLKAFSISLLECLSRTTPVQAQKEKYRKCQVRLAWHRSGEDDPILLYLRSRHYRAVGEHTQEIRYLRQIVDRHPHFVHARLMLAKACWAVAQGRAERAEKVYARDMAREFLEHYAHFLTAEEKEEFRALVAAADEGCQREGQEQDRAVRRPDGD